MVNVLVRVLQPPDGTAGIRGEVRRYVFMHFHLQIDADGAVRPDYLIRANACLRRDVAAGIRDGKIARIVTDNVMRTLNRGGHQVTRKLLATNRLRRLALPDDSNNQRGHKAKTPQQTPHTRKTAMPATALFLFSALFNQKQAPSPDMFVALRQVAQDSLHLGYISEGVGFSMKRNLQFSIVLSFLQPPLGCPADLVHAGIASAPRQNAEQVRHHLKGNVPGYLREQPVGKIMFAVF